MHDCKTRKDTKNCKTKQRPNTEPPRLKVQYPLTFRFVMESLLLLLLLLVVVVVVVLLLLFLFQMTNEQFL